MRGERPCIGTIGCCWWHFSARTVNHTHTEICVEKHFKRIGRYMPIYVRFSLSASHQTAVCCQQSCYLLHQSLKSVLKAFAKREEHGCPITRPTMRLCSVMLSLSLSLPFSLLDNVLWLSIDTYANACQVLAKCLSPSNRYFLIGKISTAAISYPEEIRQ